VAFLVTRPHSTVNFFDSLEGTGEFSLNCLQAFRNGLFRIPGDENTAIDLFLESWVPGRVCLIISNYWAWIGEPRFCGRRIDKLACAEMRITKIVRNTELMLNVRPDHIHKTEILNVLQSSQYEKMRYLSLQV
jgi:hypothetical protein